MIMWTLESGLKIIRELQPIAKEANFHLALAGSVLNCSESKKDLDIIALPFHNDQECNVIELLNKLEPKLGICRDGDERYDGSDAEGRIDSLFVFENDNRRIDLFVVHTKEENQMT